MSPMDVANDAAMLCSPRVYEDFGFSYEQQLVVGYPACSIASTGSHQETGVLV